MAYRGQSVPFTSTFSTSSSNTTILPSLVSTSVSSTVVPLLKNPSYKRPPLSKDHSLLALMHLCINIPLANDHLWYATTDHKICYFNKCIHVNWPLCPATCCQLSQKCNERGKYWHWRSVWLSYKRLTVETPAVLLLRKSELAKHSYSKRDEKMASVPIKNTWKLGKQATMSWTRLCGNGLFVPEARIYP